jgi:hypothetical protein
VSYTNLNNFDVVFSAPTGWAIDQGGSGHKAWSYVANLSQAKLLPMVPARDGYARLCHCFDRMVGHVWTASQRAGSDVWRVSL